MPRAPISRTANPKVSAAKAAGKTLPARKASKASTPVKAAPLVPSTTINKKAARASNSSPHLSFYPAKDLHSRLLALLDQIENSSDATLHRAKLAESVSELTAAGLDYYFVRTLKEARVGFVTQQSANIGLIGVKQVMTPVIRNVVERLEHDQLQAIVKSIREFMK